MRRHISTQSALLLLLVSLVLPVAADPIAIIVNSDNKQNLSIEELKYIYNENVITWPSGKRIDRYDLPPTDAARETFSRKILGLSARVAAREEQSRQVNNSARNPSREKRAPLVAAAVVRNPNALGYVTLPYAETIHGIRIMHVIKE